MQIRNHGPLVNPTCQPVILFVFVMSKNTQTSTRAVFLKGYWVNESPDKLVEI